MSQTSADPSKEDLERGWVTLRWTGTKLSFLGDTSSKSQTQNAVQPNDLSASLFGIPSLGISTSENQQDHEHFSFNYTGLHVEEEPVIPTNGVKINIYERQQEDIESVNHELKQQDRQPVPGPEFVLVFNCGACGAEFNNRHLLKAHTQLHNNESSILSASKMNQSPIFPASEMNQSSSFSASEMNQSPIFPASEINQSSSFSSEMNQSPNFPASEINQSPVFSASEMNQSSSFSASEMNQSPVSPASEINQFPIFPASEMNQSSSFTESEMNQSSILSASEINQQIEKHLTLMEETTLITSCNADKDEIPSEIVVQRVKDGESCEQGRPVIKYRENEKIGKVGNKSRHVKKSSVTKCRRRKSVVHDKIPSNGEFTDLNKKKAAVKVTDAIVVSAPSLKDVSVISDEEDKNDNCSRPCSKRRTNTRKKSFKKPDTGPFSCDICWTTFQFRGNLYHHGLKHHDLGNHKCDACNKTFSTKTNLKRHLQRHEKPKRPRPNKLMSTEIKKLIEINDLNKKEATVKVTGNVKVSSVISDKETNTREKSSKKPGTGPFRCHVCWKMFPFRSNLYRHRLTHQDLGIHKCDACDKTFITEFNLKRHLKRHEKPKTPSNELQSTQIKKPIKINDLNKKKAEVKVTDVVSASSFKDVSILSGTEINQEDTNDNRSRPYSKRRKNTRKTSSKKPGTGPFRCHVCSKTFQFRSKLYYHGLTHRDLGTHKCAACNKTFITKINLKRHLQRHEKPGYYCDMCGKSFLDFGDLRQHMFVHSGLKALKCKVCHKRISNPGNLTKHMLRIHSSDTPFKCIYCKKTFKAKFDMEKHIRIHTKEKPFWCRYCGKVFTTNSEVHAHTRTHTGEKPYECKICHKRFSASGDMSKHFKMHKRISDNSES